MNRTNSYESLGAIFLSVTLLVSCSSHTPDVSSQIESPKSIETALVALRQIQPDSQPAAYFETHVKPVVAKCRPCHFPGGKVYAQLPFDNPQTLRQLGAKLFTRIQQKEEQEVIRTFLAQTLPSSSSAAQREVAITFDDLPLSRMNPRTWRQTTDKLLASIHAQNVPALGFVNEGKLYERDRLDTARVALLQMWLAAGFELGNHSYSHWDLHRVALADYKADLLRGEEVTAKLLAQKNVKPRYFRHPFLHTGASLAVKNDVENFLHEHGYSVAPVTIDNSEWIFAHAYVLASERGEIELQRRLGEAYVPYMESKFAFYEKQSRDLFGREIKQVLLLHANLLNADYFEALATMLMKRGYAFITLEAALRDEAYRSEDTYIGPAGLSWLQRWAMTQGKPKEFFVGDPRAPEFVLKAAGIASE
jgi:peptidoglycan/xylan/chitin deacetylase (PgdA/CDA1 family)